MEDRTEWPLYLQSAKCVLGKREKQGEGQGARSKEERNERSNVPKDALREKPLQPHNLA